MIAHRISLKYFVSEPDNVYLPAFVPIFHRWIQQHQLEGLLIDVADYKHVPQGPGIILVGYEGDYALDMGGGRAGLLYTRKRNLDGDLHTVLHRVFRLALTACSLLEADASLGGKITFRTDEAELRFLDRLHTPNRPETVEALRRELAAALADVYGNEATHYTILSHDPRQPLTLRITASGAPERRTLLERLSSQAMVAG